MSVSILDIERFEKFVMMEPNTGCWLWTGFCTPNGYGYFDKQGAHRASWKIYHGPIPEGYEVLHGCDTRSCVNPRHHFLGTQPDNVADCVKKLRHTRGIKQGQAKLNDEKVKAIRMDRRSLQRIAFSYAVSKKLILLVKQRKAWMHVSP